VSPIATIFDDGHYYLIVFDKRYEKLSNYRIDRMDKVEIIDDACDMPAEAFNLDVANYKKSLFGMFSGETTPVTIEAHQTLIDAVFDLFGENTRIISAGDQTVRFTVDVQVSALFFGWCCSFGNKVKLIGPAGVVNELHAYMDEIKQRYEDR
jgi:predicted DNA-binding transcriptional regulator YafY